MVVALSASRGACHVEVRHRKHTLPGPHHCQHVRNAHYRLTYGYDKSARPDEARNPLYQHLISRLVQGWECGVLTTWKSLPVTVSGIHQSLDRLLPPNGEEILTSVVFPLSMQRFESSGTAIGLKGSTRWKERVEVRKVAICPDI